MITTAVSGGLQAKIASRRYPIHNRRILSIQDNRYVWHSDGCRQFSDLQVVEAGASGLDEVEVFSSFLDVEDDLLDPEA